MLKLKDFVFTCLVHTGMSLFCSGTKYICYCHPLEGILSYHMYCSNRSEADSFKSLMFLSPLWAILSGSLRLVGLWPASLDVAARGQLTQEKRKKRQQQRKLQNRSKLTFMLKMRQFLVAPSVPVPLKLGSMKTQEDRI